MSELKIPLVQEKNNQEDYGEDAHSRGRFRWFLGFALGGVCLTILSMFWLLRSIVTFAVLYTAGSISMIISLFILSGPKKQFQVISTRRGPALTYVASIGCTLGLALYPGIWFRSFLVLACMIVQFIALGWYTLSFFPRIQEQLKRIGRFICAAEN